MFDGAFWYRYYYYWGWASFNIENEQEHITTYNHKYFMGLFLNCRMDFYIRN